MKQVPVCYLADDLIGNEIFQSTQANIGNKWVMARPLNYIGSIGYRFKLACGVFTGKYDVVRWYKQ